MSESDRKENSKSSRIHHGADRGARTAAPRWFSITLDEVSVWARQTILRQLQAHIHDNGHDDPSDNRVIVIRGILVTQPRVYIRRNSKLAWQDMLKLAFLWLIIRRVLSWGSSAVVHALVLVILAAIVYIIPQDDDRTMTYTVSIKIPVSDTPSTQPPKGPERHPEVVADNPKKIPVEKQVPVTSELPPNPTVIDQIIPAAIGVGGGNMAMGNRPSMGPYGQRGGDGQGRGGAPPETIDAVKLGLQWLSSHQSRLGSWDAEASWLGCPMSAKAEENCISRGSYSYSGEGKKHNIPGMTGLATLAFLGAGHTHKTPGEYQEVVRKALKFLEAIQYPTGPNQGLFSTPDISDVMYNHAICTLAVAEAYGMTGDAGLKPILKKAVDYLIATQQPGGGWDYKYKDHEGKPTNRNDISITGWVAMCFNAAQLAGIEVPPAVLSRIADFIERRTDNTTGEVVYSDKEPGPGRRGHGMIAVGLLSRLYLNITREGPILTGTARMMKNLPDWAQMERQPDSPFNTDYNMYYWYYGSLVMHFLRGSNWERWNQAMIKALLPNQCKTGHRTGSWNPERNYMGSEGGRIYSTAINVLTLEVYYRYSKTYTTSKDDPTMNRQRQKLILHPNSPEPVTEKLKILHELKEDARKNPSDLEAVQLAAGMLKNSDDELRRTSFRILTELKEKTILPALIEAARNEKTELKRTFLQLIGEFQDRSTIPMMIDLLDDPDLNVREGAMGALEKITEKRLKGVEMWKAWWQVQSQKK